MTAIICDDCDTRSEGHEGTVGRFHVSCSGRGRWRLVAARDAMSEYLGAITIPDGYAGHTQPLHLCRQGPVTWGVHRDGYITYADPSRGIRPLPEVTQ